MPAARSAGRRELTKAANRAAILEAASRVFLARGFEACTIRDVIRETELAAGTFYNYFADKESLLRMLVEERLREVTVQMSDVRRHAKTPQAFVEGAYRVVFESIVADPAIYQLMWRNESAIRSLYSDDVLGLTARTLRQDLDDAMRRGVFPKMDLDLLCAAFVGAGYEIGRLLAEQLKTDASAAAAFATRLFLGGISAFCSSGDAALKLRVRAGAAPA